MINSGGAQYVYAGGTDNGTTVNSGLQVAFGLAIGTSLSSGGEQYVASGALGRPASEKRQGTKSRWVGHSRCPGLLYVADCLANKQI
jgi:autotransporter passenger strand-loop-strand repeat protein